MSQEINSCHKKSILVTRNQFLSQEINSCPKKSILATRNQFLSQEINSCHKKSFLVSSYPSNKLINLRQRVNPTKKFAWAYTFRGNLVPRFPENLPPCCLPSRDMSRRYIILRSMILISLNTSLFVLGNFMVTVLFLAPKVDHYPTTRTCAVSNP